MTKAIGIRDDGTTSPGNLKIIEDMAAQGKTQATIGAHFGLTKKKFEEHLAKHKGDNDLRLAWEAGHARHEQTIIDVMNQAATGFVEEKIEMEDDPENPGQKIKVVYRTRTITKADVLTMIYYTKARLGWRDQDAPQVNVDNRTQTLQLPASMTREQYFGMLGAGIVDGRTDQSKPLPNYVEGVRVDKADGSTKNMPLIEPPKPAPVPAK